MSKLNKEKSDDILRPEGEKPYQLLSDRWEEDSKDGVEFLKNEGENGQF